MKAVAMLGGHEQTLKYAHASEAGEMWAIGSGYRKFPVERLTRVYEIHPAVFLEDPHYNVEHWRWLHDHPDHLTIVTGESIEGVAGQQAYPFAEVAPLFRWVRRAGKPNLFLTSSIDYMIAAAIVEGYERIELYGFDMTGDNSTEYLYQVPGLAYWTGFAAGRGVYIDFPEEFTHLRQKVYAWDIGANMVPRTTLQKRLIDFTNQTNDARTQVNYWTGVAQERQRMLQNAKTPALQQLRIKALQGAEAQLQNARDQLMVSEGARQAVQQLIDNFDMKEPEELRNPFEEILGV